MNVEKLKQMARPLIPSGMSGVVAQLHARRQNAHDDHRRAMFKSLVANVHTAVETIRSLDPAKCTDVAFLERELIPTLGLNDENLNEQPAELSSWFGTGIHIFQYPNQLARYLAWLAVNARGVQRYAEIGVRWGGTFILTSEWLRKIGCDLQSVLAVDPIDPSPFIKEYMSLLEQESKGRIAAKYLQAFSTADEAHRVLHEVRPDLVLIDGDHSFRGAIDDHMLVRANAEIIVHHDIASDACPDTHALWQYLKVLESPTFESVEFCDQYASVAGSFLGIGAMKRKVTAKPDQSEGQE